MQQHSAKVFKLSFSLISIELCGRLKRVHFLRQTDRKIRLANYCTLSLRPRQLPVKVSNETKQLPARPVSIQIYSDIARFSGDSTAFLS